MNYIFGALLFALEICSFVLLGISLRYFVDRWWPASRLRRWLLDPKRRVPGESDPYFNREYARPEQSTFKHDPETCPNHPPASTLEAVWCAECGANSKCNLGDPADGPIKISRD